MVVKQAFLNTPEWDLHFPYFKPEEVLSPDGLKAFDIFGAIVINFEALSFLHRFREFVAAPLLVNHGTHVHRGYRSFVENTQVGGESFSFHMQGVAFDITCPDMSVSELAAAAEDFGWHGIGIYPTRNFVHCDLRPKFIKEKATKWQG